MAKDLMVGMGAATTMVVARQAPFLYYAAAILKMLPHHPSLRFCDSLDDVSAAIGTRERLLILGVDGSMDVVHSMTSAGIEFEGILAPNREQWRHIIASSHQRQLDICVEEGEPKGQLGDWIKEMFPTQFGYINELLEIGDSYTDGQSGAGISRVEIDLAKERECGLERLCLALSYGTEDNLIEQWKVTSAKP